MQFNCGFQLRVAETCAAILKTKIQAHAQNLLSRFSFEAKIYLDTDNFYCFLESILLSRDDGSDRYKPTAKSWRWCLFK